MNEEQFYGRPLPERLGDNLTRLHLQEQADEDTRMRNMEGKHKREGDE